MTAGVPSASGRTCSRARHSGTSPCLGCPNVCLWDEFSRNVDMLPNLVADNNMLTHAISTQRAPSWDIPQAFVCKCNKLNLINPSPALPACTQQPYRPLVQLYLSVSEVRHLLEGVDGDEHRPDVGLGSKSRSKHPLPCPPVLPITSEHSCLLVRQHQE